MTTSEIPVPDRLLGFPFYKGFLVHFTVWVDAEGVPDFRVVHEANRRKCMEEEWCALCGKPLSPVKVFIGGPGSVESRMFLDGPMHEECALYAVKACPYLAIPDYHERPLELSRAKIEESGEIPHEVAEALPGRPAKMALVYVTSYRLLLDRPTITYRAGFPVKVDWDTIPQRG